MPNIFSFHGRISRSQFLKNRFMLFFPTLLVTIVGLYFAFKNYTKIVLFLSPGDDEQHIGGFIGFIFLSLLYMVFVTLFFSVPNQIRRFHDRNKSAWWVLLNLIPIIGWSWVWYECHFLEGTVGPNRYGAEPLQENTQISSTGQNPSATNIQQMQPQNQTVGVNIQK